MRSMFGEFFLLGLQAVQATRRVQYYPVGRYRKMDAAGISLIERKSLLTYSETSLDYEEQVVIADNLISATKSGASRS